VELKKVEEFCSLICKIVIIDRQRIHWMKVEEDAVAIYHHHLSSDRFASDPYQIASDSYQIAYLRHLSEFGLDGRKSP
jgi:hypothetical protein